MVIELVLPQSRTPAVERKEILHGYRTSATAVPHSRSRKKKKYYTGIELVLPKSCSPALEKKKEILHGIQLVLPQSRTPALEKKKQRNITWVYN